MAAVNVHRTCAMRTFDVIENALLTITYWHTILFNYLCIVFFHQDGEEWYAQSML